MEITKKTLQYRRPIKNSGGSIKAQAFKGDVADKNGKIELALTRLLCPKHRKQSGWTVYSYKGKKSETAVLVFSPETALQIIKALSKVVDEAKIKD